MNKIIIKSSDKSTTIRLKEKTKKMLESVSKGKETHERIILRLINIAEKLSQDNTTEIVQKGNIIGTKYSTLHKTFNIEIEKINYQVLCSYNDISPISLMKKPILDWEIDLEIININKGKGWISPKNFSKSELDKIYFICLKQILEQTFDITLYQFSTLDDYLNIEKWMEAYKKYNLSNDSLTHDIKNKLK